MLLLLHVILLFWRREAGNVALKLFIDGHLLVCDAAHLQANLLGHALGVVHERTRVAVAFVFNARKSASLVFLHAYTNISTIASTVN